MDQSSDLPNRPRFEGVRAVPPPADTDQSARERALAVLLGYVERLDELELTGVEPATTFGWPREPAS